MTLVYDTALWGAAAARGERLDMRQRADGLMMCLKPDPYGRHIVPGLMHRILFLEDLAAGANSILLLLRVFVGAFLVWGVWDNIVSAERMAEFAAFLELHQFPWPHLAAPLSVWAQFTCGVLFILGLFARWAGLICAVNFAVALIMVDAEQGLRAAFPAAMLVLVGLYLAARGPGTLAIDRLILRPPVHR